MVNSPLFGIQLLTGGSDYPTPDSTADVKQFNDAILAMEKFLGVIICTSGTRPSSPKKQQIIVETDTGLTYYYSGTAWVALFENIDTSIIPIGDNAQRNAAWGTPTTAADRKALANKCARWSNNTTGWMEQYFAGTGDGANAQVTVATAGWYPVAGCLPAGALSTTTAQAYLTQEQKEVVLGTTDYLSPGIVKSGNGLTVTYAGIYQISGRTGWALGAGVEGARIASIRVNNVAVGATGTSISAHSQGITSPAFSIAYDLPAGAKVSLDGRQASGNSLNLVEGALTVNYLRPPKNG